MSVCELKEVLVFSFRVNIDLFIEPHNFPLTNELIVVSIFLIPPIRAFDTHAVHKPVKKKVGISKKATDDG
jgi:hypothetical protein